MTQTPLDKAAIDHSCNVVRRQIQAEMPGLTMFFIPHPGGGRAAALAARQHELQRNAGGTALLRPLQGRAQAPDDASEFVGIGIGTVRKMGIFRKRALLAAAFINTDEFERLEDLRRHLYHMVWHAIRLVQYEKNAETDLFELRGAVMRPQHTPVTLARENMLADVFAAMIQRLLGVKGAIHDLAVSRSLTALQPVPGARPELFPFPIAADAAELVYKDLADTLVKTRMVQQAVSITEEIDLTYDDNSIRHWSSFCTAAQEMAWLGHGRDKILGTAIYTSEDPYVRSTAYLVAEALGMEPAPPADLSSYNPFTDPEVNERLHNKTCEEDFKALLSKLGDIYDEKAFMTQIDKQNENLMKGYPVGWCAHALLRAADAFKNADPAQVLPAAVAAEAFQKARGELPWNSLRMISRMVMTRRRQGTHITALLIEEFCERTASLMVVGDTFRKLSARARS